MCCSLKYTSSCGSTHNIHIKAKIADIRSYIDTICGGANYEFLTHDGLESCKVNLHLMFSLQLFKNQRSTEMYLSRNSYLITISSEKVTFFTERIPTAHDTSMHFVHAHNDLISLTVCQRNCISRFLYAAKRAIIYTALMHTHTTHIHSRALCHFQFLSLSI